MRQEIIEQTVRLALREDIGTGDVTTAASVSPDRQAVGKVISKAEGVLAGLPVVEEVFHQVDPSLSVRRVVSEGSRIQPGDLLCEVFGHAHSILIGERVALNFLQRLSGIATLTARFVEIVSKEARSGTEARSTNSGPPRIVDTRKTTPGLRALEKYAVTVGGGHNHRMGLYDAVMIKDNHIVAVGGIASAVRAARAAIPHTMTITVECETMEQVDQALEAGADVLLLDNMSNELRAEAVRRAAGRALTEASGGITEATAAGIAATGVDILSIGALTHSAHALDFSLDLELR